MSTARLSSAERHLAISAHKALPAAATLAVIAWIGVVAAQGALLALRASGPPATGTAAQNVVSSQMIGAAGLVYLSCFLITVATRWLRPTWTTLMAYGCGGLIVFAGAIATRSVIFLATAMAFCSLAGVVGNFAVRFLPHPPVELIVRAPIALALGFGILGTLFLLLAALSWLNTASVLGLAAVVLLASMRVSRERWRSNVAQLRNWRPMAPTWFETVIIGLSVGLVSFAMLAAFVPEVPAAASDVTRQHLALSREIWQTGSAPVFWPLTVSAQPMLGHLLFAVAWGFGGASAVKLLQLGMAIATIAAVAGVGWQCHGRVAAVTGAVIFATIPMNLWIDGHAYPDVLATLFAVTAMLGVLLWQRNGQLMWLVVAGALAGFGFATKLGVALFIIAMAAALFLIGRESWQWRSRFTSVFAFGIGAAASVAPWLIRSLLLTGSIPGLNQARNLLGALDSSRPVPPKPAADVGAVAAQPTGLQRSIRTIVGGPWHLTFDGAPARYRSITVGEFGISALMLAPLALLGPRTRSTALLALVALISYLGWVFTLQVPRHLMPTLAITAALAGIGVANAAACTSSMARRARTLAAQTGLIAGLVAVPFFFLPNTSTRLPIDLFLGQVSVARFLEREVPAYATLSAASTLLPPDTLVGYVSLWKGSQLYTEARLLALGQYADDDRTFLDHTLGTTPDQVMASLDRLGLRYFIWNQTATRPEDWQSTLLSGDFLRRHTRILAGDADSYLFAVLPDDSRIWGIAQPVNLLQNPDFFRIRRDDGAWTVTGGVQENDGIVTLRSDGSIAQRVPISSGAPYLFEVKANCATASNRIDLNLHWMNAAGAPIASNSERVHPGKDASYQFVWAIAPEGTTAVMAETAIAGGGNCDIAEIALYDAR